MSEAAKMLSEQVRVLPPVERLEVVEEILDSLDETTPELDKLWANEAQDRLMAWRCGKIRAIPLDEVLSKYRRT